MVICQGQLLLHLDHGFHQLLPRGFRFMQPHHVNTQLILRVPRMLSFPGHCDFLLVQRFQGIRRAGLQCILIRLAVLHFLQQAFQLILPFGKRIRQFFQFALPGEQVNRLG